MAEYLTNTTDLTAVANAIREKGGTSKQLASPDGFVAAIQASQTGAPLQIAVTTNAGATVTATKGSKTVSGTADTSGHCTLTVDEAGTWTITAATASTTKTSDVVVGISNVDLPLVDSVLNNNSWETIKKVSDAGQGENYWSVGDTKTITINGKVGNTTFSNLSVDAFILGFNHNASREGSNRIHFQIGKINGTLVGLVDGNYGSNTSTTGAFTMNTSNTNSGGWNNSHMRKTVLGSNSASATSPAANTLLAALPADLRAVMKPATKYSDNTGGRSDTASHVTSTTDLLPLLSEFEYHGARSYANSAEKNYQAQYDYYRAGNSKVHYKHNATGTAARAWCRSFGSSGSYGFCLVYTDGSAYRTDAYCSWALAPCFFV